jgi:hypothetical protein
MDARRGRATFGAARLENGNSYGRPEIKTYGASHTQATGHLEQTLAGENRTEGEEIMLANCHLRLRGQEI